MVKVVQIYAGQARTGTWYKTLPIWLTGVLGSGGVMLKLPLPTETDPMQIKLPVLLQLPESKDGNETLKGSIQLKEEDGKSMPQRMKTSNMAAFENPPLLQLCG